MHAATAEAVRPAQDEPAILQANVPRWFGRRMLALARFGRFSRLGISGSDPLFPTCGDSR